MSSRSWPPGWRATQPGRRSTSTAQATSAEGGLGRRHRSALGNLSDQGEGQFADAGGVIAQRESLQRNGRGLAAAGYDNDGDVDIAINSIGGPLVLLRSSGAAGHWLEVKLSAFSPGARVTAVLPDGRRLVREVQAGSKARTVSVSSEVRTEAS